MRTWDIEVEKVDRMIEVLGIGLVEIEADTSLDQEVAIEGERDQKAGQQKRNVEVVIDREAEVSSVEAREGPGAGGINEAEVLAVEIGAEVTMKRKAAIRRKMVQARVLAECLLVEPQRLQGRRKRREIGARATTAATEPT